jgi:hypothetical protein
MQYGQPAPKNTTVTQTTTTTTTGNNPNSVGMNVNMPGINLNVNVNEPANYGTQTTTTTTTTTGGGTVYENHSGGNNNGGYTTHYDGCSGRAPMSTNEFNSALATIHKASFSDTKISTAKTICQSNCLSSAQIASICKEFSFEDAKLDFAKFAYDYCTDTKSYFKVNNVFSFSSSVEELNEYIRTK